MSGDQWFTLHTRIRSQRLISVWPARDFCPHHVAVTPGPCWCRFLWSLAASTDPDTFPLQMASCNQERPYCTASRLKPPRVHSFTVPHATLPPALSQYRRTGNPERFGFIAAPNWFASPAHFVNGRGHSSSVESGLSVFHMYPQHVVSQFHTDPMLLSFSVVRRFHHGHWHTCVADCHQW